MWLALINPTAVLKTLDDTGPVGTGEILNTLRTFMFLKI